MEAHSSGKPVGARGVPFQRQPAAGLQREPARMAHQHGLLVTCTSISVSAP